MGAARSYAGVGALLIVGATLAAPGCTDVRLQLAHDAKDLADKVAIRGQACTRLPVADVKLTRVIFAIDSSDSMLFNDPDNLIVDAIENVVTSLQGKGHVTYGVLRWGERAIRELTHYEPPGTAPDLFTKDAAVLAKVWARMRQLAVENPDRYLGGTNYEMALDEIRDYIVEAQAATPGLASEMQYLIVFVTDGMPQAGDKDPALTRTIILEKVTNLTLDYAATLVPAHLGEVATTTAEFLDLLPEMAQRGGGEYIQVNTAVELQPAFKEVVGGLMHLVEYQIMSAQSTYDFRSLIVSNETVRIAEVEGVIDVYVDSDADGLVDAQELLLGTDPGSVDTDGDGLWDFFEHRFDGEFVPFARRFPPLTAEELSDEDGDGLNFFIERHIGTRSENADTDGDGFPDGLEFVTGTRPLDSDADLDLDEDGVSNGVELMQHTHPDLEEGAVLRDEFAYRIESMGDPIRIFNGQRCYDVRVSNITLREGRRAMTRNEVETPEGFNRIQLSWMEEPIVDDPSRDLSRLPNYAANKGTFIIFRPSQSLRDPPALELDLREGSLP